jgi:hypothetical protein
MAPNQDWIAPDDQEALNERAAIMAYDGGMSTDEAEAAARLAFSIATHFQLALIKTDVRTQTRVSINVATVDEYTEALQDGADLPAVTVFDDGAEYWLADGFHRVAAYRKQGRVTIPAKVHSGSQRDALLFSCGANAKHGLRRSNEDKRKAVGILLADAEWSKLSDREIARHCGVSNMLVAAVRNPASERTFTSPPPVVTPPAPPPPSPPGGNIATPTPSGSGTPTGGTEPAAPAPQHPAPPPAEPAEPTDAEKNADEAHGGTTLAELLEEAQKELAAAAAQLEAAAADDLKAEAMKQKRIAAVAVQRQNELMDTVKKREAEIARHVKSLRRIGKAVGEDDPAKVAAAVEMFVKHSHRPLGHARLSMSQAGVA